MNSLAIAAYMRDESHILHEWLQHHLNQGVDHFLLFDNGSEDSTLDVLRNFKPHVTLLSRPDTSQVDCYREAYTIANKRFKWLGYIDLDEFAYSTKSKVTLSQRLTNAASRGLKEVRVNWRMFLPTALRQPNSIIRQSTLAVYKDNQATFPYKTFFQPGEHVQQVRIHCPQMNYPVLSVSGASESIALNHYRFQSYEYLLGVKAGRGGGVTKNKYDVVQGLQLLASYFDTPSRQDKRLQLLSTELTTGLNRAPAIRPATHVYESSIWSYIEANLKDPSSDPRQLLQQVTNHAQKAFSHLYKKRSV